MTPDYKVFAFDLDGTLAPSKSPVEPSMVATLCELLNKRKVAVLSGASIEQFETQFVQHLECNLSNLLIFSENGSALYIWENGVRKNIYTEHFTEEEQTKILAVLDRMLAHFELKEANYGPLVENRGGQITFSGAGQQAPIDVKKIWDPDQKKRQAMREFLMLQIPEFEIRIGGMTSIDITRKGITKAFAILKMIEFLNVEKKDVVYYGDALYKGGNDEIVISSGVKTIAVSSPQETEKLLRDILRTI